MSGCVICGGADGERIFERCGMPKSGQFLVSELEPYATTILNLFGCGTCGLLWLDTAPLGKIDYTAVSRGTGRQLPKYKNELIRRVAGHAGADGLVVEVGANDGSFACLLLERKVGRAVVAIEPSLAFAENYAGSGIQLISRHLNRHTAAEVRAGLGAARVVVCRHTLEHIPDPVEFLLALNDLLAEEGMLVIEVPDSSTLTARYALHEIWDEHLYYFSEQNALALVAHNGFHTLESRVYPHLGSENLVIYARRRSGASRNEVVPARSGFDMLSFRARVERLTTDLKRRAAVWRKPVVALGASHPQTNFLSITDIAQFVDYLVDDDRDKQGKYVPVAGRSPLPVVSMEEALGRIGPRTILLTAFGYPEWIARVQKQFKDRDVRFVDPYLVAAAGNH